MGNVGRSAPLLSLCRTRVSLSTRWLTQCAVELRTGTVTSSNGHGSVGGQPQASRQAVCTPTVLCKGAGPAAEDVRGRRHPPAAKEERGNRGPDPSDGVAAVSGI